MEYFSYPNEINYPKQKRLRIQIKKIDTISTVSALAEQISLTSSSKKGKNRRTALECGAPSVNIHFFYQIISYILRVF